jgi:hypothetical protein
MVRRIASLRPTHMQVGRSRATRSTARPRCSEDRRTVGQAPTGAPQRWADAQPRVAQLWERDFSHRHLHTNNTHVSRQLSSHTAHLHADVGTWAVDS